MKTKVLNIVCESKRELIRELGRGKHTGTIILDEFASWDTNKSNDSLRVLLSETPAFDVDA